MCAQLGERFEYFKFDVLVGELGEYAEHILQVVVDEFGRLDVLGKERYGLLNAGQEYHQTLYVVRLYIYKNMKAQITQLVRHGLVEIKY